MSNHHTTKTAAALQMHGHDWDGRDVTGWHASEKLDGCRAYWDGATLYSKSGNPIEAPSITNELPADFALDGEIWAGRGNLQTARIFTQYGHHAERVAFFAFDAPNEPGDWPQRLQAAQLRGVQTVGVWTIDGMQELEAALAGFLNAGAEGLMVRRPGTAYRPGRTSNLLKVKAHSLALFDDCHNMEDFAA